jgi:hypothetical protein
MGLLQRLSIAGMTVCSKNYPIKLVYMKPRSVFPLRLFFLGLLLKDRLIDDLFLYLGD